MNPARAMQRKYLSQKLNLNPHQNPHQNEHLNKTQPQSLCQKQKQSWD